MIIALAVALLATAAGALATYLYDDAAPLASRICTGCCTGLAALGLIGFILALVAGLSPLTIGVALILIISPGLLVLRSPKRQRLQNDVDVCLRSIRKAISRPTRSQLGYFLYYAIAAVVLWQVFDRAMIEKPDGIYTGLLKHFGYLPFHLSVITGFAHGNNFPPDDPTYSGVRFTYPFLTDFISAIFVKCGASLSESMFIENLLVSLSLIGLLHRWVWELLRDRLAALMAPIIVILNGGLGFLLLFSNARKDNQGLYAAIRHLAPSFTIIPNTPWRWGNSISTLLVPQRGMLLGLALAVIVFTQWWLATTDPAPREDEKTPSKSGSKKRKKSAPVQPKVTQPPAGASNLLSSPVTISMIAAGLFAGLLPLVHAHTFVVVMVVSAGICLLHFVTLRKYLPVWIIFAVVASVIALPQLWWSTHGSEVKSSTFFAFAFGWDSALEDYFNYHLAAGTLQTMPWVRTVIERTPDVVLFWLKNTGLMFPLLITAFAWRGKRPVVSRRLLLYYLPFTLCFIIPNFMTLAPWVWDNIKVLFYWWVASAPIVALVLARLWRRDWSLRVLSAACFVALVFAGALDVIGIVARTGEYQLFDQNGIQFAELVKQQTNPRALIVHAPVHNTPIFLTGRRSLMGYPGHIWTHGLEFAPREAEIKRVYAGAPDADAVLRKYHVD